MSEMGEVEDMAIDYDVFRQEVRDFLESEYTADMQRLNQRQAGLIAEPELGLRWHRILAKRGWIAPGWPVEHGGTGWNALQRHIFETECAAASTPAYALQGLMMVGPAIMQFGTQEQKDYFLPRIYSGDCYFCQGFSEPNSGSDLASLRTRAIRDGDDYVVDGSKIWTTHAHFANWIFLIARSSTEGKPQAGITFLLAPMTTKGITVRPIISISGEHELNEVFFDAVHIPVKHRLGDENKGWDVAKYLLTFERGISYAAGARGMLERAKQIAQQQPGDQDDRLWDDPYFRRRVAEQEIDLLALDAMEHRITMRLTAGASVDDATAAMMKVSGTELLQRTTEICAETLGDYALADQRRTLVLSSTIPPVGPDYAAKPVAKYLNARAASIYGGTNEVLKNVIARAAMGLK